MDDRAGEWVARATSHWSRWPVAGLLELKARLGVTVSAVVPARDEEETVGVVVEVLRTFTEGPSPLLDEVVVMDSDSTDATAEVAAKAGAVVHRTRDVEPALGSHPGKGEAVWKSLFVTRGDLLVFLDGDLTEWGPHYVPGLLGPLLTDPSVSLVKGFYDRPGGDPDGTGGGRVTELVARPLISAWWPELAGVVQPLAGEWAARRSLLERLPIPTGYGVELATLLDTVTAEGLDAVAQVDLDVRGHRSQSTRDLGLMAAELLLLAERRRKGAEDPATDLVQPGRTAPGHPPTLRTRPVPTLERPPARTARPQPVPDAQ